MDISTIVYHTAMDISDWGHNVYFVKKMGLQNVKRLHKVVYYGDLPTLMTLAELKVFLQKRGFNIEGQVWQSSRADDKISSVVYCSGMGGMLLGPNHIIDVSKIEADVYITGQLMVDPKSTPNKFKYIIELGHTSSEKPLFRRIKVQLENRWENLQVDLAPRSVDLCPTGEVCKTYPSKKVFRRYQAVNKKKVNEDDIFKPYSEEEHRAHNKHRDI
jgi:putative NIF3 family GTP cyclohydrolase 1 type 2